MNYQETVNKISQIAKFPQKPSLERIEKLLNLMGNPQKKLNFIHVAGTNGKGTTCSYIASVLKESGYKTGLFTSPYIIDFTERFQINNQMIDKNELVKQAEYVFNFINQVQGLTEFEFITALAFNWFASQNCDIVVLEVGLGGKYDATNIIKKPLASVICSISLDHTKILGDTVELIAKEKAGIIKENCPTVCYNNQKDSVTQIIKNTCLEMQSNFILSKKPQKIISENLNGSCFKIDNLEIFIPFCGEHQINNATLAYETIKILQNSYSISEKAIVNGFKNTKILARVELISENPLFILDGSHNSSGGFELRKLIDKHLNNTKICLLIAMVEDKDYSDYIAVLAPIAEKVICCQISNNPRALKAEALASFAQMHCEFVESEKSISNAVDKAIKSGLTVVACGSLYFASEIRPIVLEKLKKLSNCR